MECPECLWQNSTEQKFCSRCRLFLLYPDANYYLASYGHNQALHDKPASTFVARRGI